MRIGGEKNYEKALRYVFLIIKQIEAIPNENRTLKERNCLIKLYKHFHQRDNTKLESYILLKYIKNYFIEKIHMLQKYQN